MKLTKKQKVHVLTEVSELLESKQCRFICGAIVMALMNKGYKTITHKDCFNIFPEFLEYKPEGLDEGQAWFKRASYNSEEDKGKMVYGQWKETLGAFEVRARESRLEIVGNVIQIIAGKKEVINQI